MFAVCCLILFKIDYSTLYFTLQRYLENSKLYIIFLDFYINLCENYTFRSDFGKNRQAKTCY